MSATVFIQLPVTRAGAPDHIDSPIITQDHGSDSADLRAFADPNDSSKVVLIMSTQDFIVSGDAKADSLVDLAYSKGLERVMPQTAAIELAGGKKFTAPFRN